VRRTLRLRVEPTVRQTQAILDSVEREISRYGARVERVGGVALRFRMSAPWRRPHLGSLLAISAGRVTVSAGLGGPWRVQYELSTALLRGAAIALSVVLVAVGLSWPRVTLVGALGVLWLVVYAAPYYLATRGFRRMVRAAAQEIVERRKKPRVESQPDNA
jgi:hypothetical protein